jgi:uncharacterized membrane protein HdeD (DUF308 family)
MLPTSEAMRLHGATALMAIKWLGNELTISSNCLRIDDHQGSNRHFILSFESDFKAYEDNMSTHTATGREHTSAWDSDRFDAMSAVLAENWWAVALRGVLAILFGVIALLVPVTTILALVLLFAAYMFVDGVFAIISAVRAARRRERWALLVFEGVVDLIAGAVALFFPGLTVLAFVLLTAAWALVSGALMFAASFQLNRDHGRWWLALGGIASMIFGILLFLAPLIGAIVLTWWMGAYALVFGAMLLVLAFKLRNRRGEHHPVGQTA